MLQGKPDLAGDRTGQWTISWKPTDDGSLRTLRNVPPGEQVRVWASGYADQFLMLRSNGVLDVALRRQDIKAAYLTGPVLGDEATLDYSDQHD